MERLNKLRLLNRQYQTRKQLQQLTSHLLNDIAVTKEMSDIEVQKNRKLPLLFTLLRYLVNGD